MKTPRPQFDDSHVPLARLFSMALRDLMDGLHGRLRSAGFDDVKSAYGYILLAARQQPPTIGEVAHMLGVTKQAASKLVDGMQQAGYVACRNDAHDARSRRVHLRKRGIKLLATVESIYADLEAEWMQTLGEARVERLRGDLTRALRAAHNGQLPAIRPSW